MLRQAHNVSIAFQANSVFSGNGSVRLQIGNELWRTRELTRDQFLEERRHIDRDMVIFWGSVQGRRYWSFNGAIYWDDEGLNELDVHARLVSRKRRRAAVRRQASRRAHPSTPRTLQPA